MIDQPVESSPDAIVDDSARFLAALIESSDDAIIGKDVEGVIRSWNAGAERLYGYAATEVVGQSVSILVPPELAHDLPGIMDRLSRGGRIHHYQTVRVRKDGTRVDVSLSVSPILDDDGTFVGASSIARDITRQKRTAAFDRLLARAGKALNAPLDPEATLQRLAELAVVTVADFCLTYLVDDAGRVRRVGLAHVEPDKKRLLAALERSHDPDHETHPARRTVTTGEMVFRPDLGPEEIEELSRGTDHLHLLRQLAPRSTVVTALEVRGRRVGALVAATVEGGRRPFSEADLPRIRDLGRRAALSVDNALLLERTRASEERLNVALDTARMGTWDWDIHAGTIVWSELLERIHGREPGTFPGTLDAFREEIHPADLARVEEAIRAAVQGETPGYEVEYRCLWPDGQLRWLAANATVLRDEEGKALRMIGVCTDVTQRRKADAADRFLSAAGEILGSSLDYEATLRAVSELAIPEIADWCAVDLLEEEGIRRVSVAHPDEEARQAIEELASEMPPKLDAPVGIGAVIRTGQPQLLSEIDADTVRAAGHGEAAVAVAERLRIRSALVVPLQVGATRFGAITFAHGHSGRRFGPEDVGLATAIASRAAAAIDNARLYQETRRTAEELEGERARLAAIFRRAPAFIAVLSGPDHVFVTTNPSFDGLVGRGKLEGRPVREALPELEGQGYFALLDRVYRTGVPHEGSGTRIQLQRTPGAPPEESYLNFVYQPLHDREGAVSGIFVHGVDVTELVRARQAAEQAVSTRDDLLAFVSHDFRNFLGVVEAGAHTLLDLPLSPEEQREGLERMVRASQQALRLTDDLIENAKADAGGLELRLQTVRAEAIGQACVEDFLGIASGQGVQIETGFPEALPSIRADPDHLQRVLSNLLSNAIKHSPEGGIIEVGARWTEGDRVVTFFVRDQGDGIPEEELDRIFDRYWQARSARRAGAGLGLAIAKGIVESHGGSIRVESEPGRGSVFLFDIPAVRETGSAG